MKVQFLADADLNKIIVIGILRREPLLDFLSAHEARLRALKDSDVLAMAARQKRVLVTHDVGTMPTHVREFRKAGNRCSGVFLLPQRLDAATAIDELLLVWAASDAAEWEDRIVWLPL